MAAILPNGTFTLLSSADSGVITDQLAGRLTRIVCSLVPPAANNMFPPK